MTSISDTAATIVRCPMSTDKSQISNLKSKLATIKLPISKSIANRLLLLQAIHGDSLLRVSSDMPDDVLVLHDALQQIRDIFGTPAEWHFSPSLVRVKSSARSDAQWSSVEQSGVGLYLKNCGTALRFLQVHIAQCYPGAPITLTGDPRLMERDGKPTTQTTSARILHGEDIPVEPNESPYITMSRRMAEAYSEFRERSYSETVLQRSGPTGVAGLLEADWSAASYWYEYVAIHGGSLLLEGLTSDSLQGDRIVADLYAKYFSGLTATRSYNEVVINFVNIPDLYPAIALTCERLGITLHATGTERLRYKESDRLEAVRLHEVRNDHRIAMALMAADYPVPQDEQRCIAKSYPAFVAELCGV